MKAASIVEVAASFAILQLRLECIARERCGKARFYRHVPANKALGAKDSASQADELSALCGRREDKGGSGSPQGPGQQGAALVQAHEAHEDIVGGPTTARGREGPLWQPEGRRKGVHEQGPVTKTYKLSERFLQFRTWGPLSTGPAQNNELLKVLQAGSLVRNKRLIFFQPVGNLYELGVFEAQLN